MIICYQVLEDDNGCYFFIVVNSANKNNILGTKLFYYNKNYCY